MRKHAPSFRHGLNLHFLPGLLVVSPTRLGVEAENFISDDDLLTDVSSFSLAIDVTVLDDGLTPCFLTFESEFCVVVDAAAVSDELLLRTVG